MYEPNHSIWSWFDNILKGQRQPSSFVHPWGKYWIRDVSQMPYSDLVIGTELGETFHTRLIFLNSNHLTPSGFSLLVSGEYNWQI